MKSRSLCIPAPSQEPSKRRGLTVLFLALCAGLCLFPAVAHAVAPQWLHALAQQSVPAYDDRTDAVVLYSEQTIEIQSPEKMRTRVRKAYKILQPGGREYAQVVVYLNSNKKITGLQGWCIPTHGQDYEVRNKDSVEVAPTLIAGSELMSDVKARILQIPAPDPGAVIGFEYEVEEYPLFLEDIWELQEDIPTREAHYSLQIPNGWEYKAKWLNHPEVAPTQTGSNRWEWVARDIGTIRPEPDMPPTRAVAGQMVLYFFPSGGATPNAFSNWQQMGDWYRGLTAARRNGSPEIKQNVIALTQSVSTPSEKMQAIAQYMQRNIRYVAIELGIGGWQPHPATEVLKHQYGDCKDKATLTSAMLKEIGVDSYYVVINARRGAVTRETPAEVFAFNHVVVAIKVPDGVADPSFVAVVQHPTLGKLLFFDPTNEITPFGQIGGYLQANYGLLVTPAGGELIELPEEPAAMNGRQRIANLALDLNGNLSGDVKELLIGDRAMRGRYVFREAKTENEKIKPLESQLASSLSNFRITRVSVINPSRADLPFGFNYSFTVNAYAKDAGGMLLVRPRVIGIESSGLLERKEPRHFAVEFEGPWRDSDTIEISVPLGYEVDHLPPPMDVDYEFASYHSKTEMKGTVLRYSRTFEMKQVSVPLNEVEDLKKFYRQIANDERSIASLKPTAK